MPFDRISVGHVEVFALLDGVRDIDTHITEAFPGSPPDELLAHRSRHPGIYGEGDCWRLAIRAWLIRHADGLILVDTGIGQATAPGVEWFGATGELHTALSEAGSAASDIGTVVISHVHDDHVGGTVDTDGAPAFPNARYLIHHADIEWLREAAKEDDEDRAVWETLLAPLEDAGAIDALDGDKTLAPGISVHHAPGHTPGHQIVRIAGDDGTRALIAADTFNHPAQLAHPDWPSAPDDDHAMAAATRRSVLAELAADPATTIAPTHFGEAFGHMVTGADHSAAWEPLSPPP
jgi:glyoxylase-like metal-dependent hydrolase (beta-lactamase superfamily II)